MEIIIRSTLVFVFLLVIMRVIGKKELAELSGFEMVLLVVMGDITQQGVTQEDMSLTGSFLAVSTMALLVIGLSWISLRSSRARTLITGLPTVVLRDGRFLAEAAKLERLTEDDIKEAARQRGIEDLRDIRLGILEPDGRFTFLTGERSGSDTS